MTGASSLPHRIRIKIDARVLPAVRADNLYAGYGRGQRCNACDESIDGAQVEYEMTFADDRVYRLHVSCAALWEAECCRRDDGLSEVHSPGE
jgi:hypothetical protein